MNKSNRLGWLAVISGILIVCLCFAATGAGLTLLAQRSGFDLPVLEQSSTEAKAEGPFTRAEEQPRTPVENSSSNSTSDTPSSEAAPPLPAPAVASEQTLAAVLAAVLPREDLADIAIRYKGVKPEQTATSCPTLAAEYKVGATRAFTLTNTDENTYFQVQARLEYKTDHAYMWVQTAPRRARLNLVRLRRAADTFEKTIYPATRAFFGEEDSPGVDCDQHVHMLHVMGVGQTVGGYFSSPDSYPRAVRSDSNEGQMFVLNASPGFTGALPDSEGYLSTVAHEFQHMVSYNQTNGNALWLEEGAAQLSERLNGFADAVGTVFNFAAQPETQLNTWADGTPGSNTAHYGAGYLFWSYLYDRFGADVTKALARNPDRSIKGIVQALSDAGVTNPDTGTPLSFEQLFADFVIANYMNREAIEPNRNRYNYTGIDVPPMAVRGSLSASDFPVDMREAVAQFGTHYFELKGNSPVTVDFKGDTAVRLLPTDGEDGSFWWSNRADQSNTRLTREVDLTKAASATATLKFRAWYRLEKDYDYAYASVSEDGGKTWKTLKTTTCTTENKLKANLGCGFNGQSGGPGERSSSPQWIDEQADLSAYISKKILVRFEMVTDAGANREGLAIDNIEIPEIGFTDDGTNANNGWQVEGWVRVENALPQTWAVQVIVTNSDGTRSLQRVSLNDGAGSLTLDFGGKVRGAILAVSPTTLVTTEQGQYSLQIK